MEKSPQKNRSTIYPVSVLLEQKSKPSLIYFEQAYQYVTDSLVVPANSTNQDVYPVDLNFDFVACRFSYVSSIAHSGALATFNIMIKSNDKQMFQAPVPAELFAGVMHETAAPLRTVNGLALWFEFKRPFYFPAKSDIVIQLTDTSGYANTITFVLDGYKREKSSF